MDVNARDMGTNSEINRLIYLCTCKQTFQAFASIGAVAVSDRRRDAGARTKQRLMDATLELLAERGEDGVTLRDITTAADANVASVSYHFGSLGALCCATAKQAVTRLLDEQLARLQALDDDATVEQIAGAIATPIIAALSDREHPGPRAAADLRPHAERPAGRDARVAQGHAGARRRRADAAPRARAARRLRGRAALPLGLRRRHPAGAGHGHRALGRRGPLLGRSRAACSCRCSPAPSRAARPSALHRTFTGRNPPLGMLRRCAVPGSPSCSCSPGARRAPRASRRPRGRRSPARQAHAGAPGTSGRADADPGHRGDADPARLRRRRRAGAGRPAGQRARRRRAASWARAPPRSPRAG